MNIFGIYSERQDADLNKTGANMEIFQLTKKTADYIIMLPVLILVV